MCKSSIAPTFACASTSAERGETLACGSGACAAVVAGIARSLLDARVTVTTRGGDLGISWAGAGRPVMMTGPAVAVFDGEVSL